MNNSQCGLRKQGFESGSCHVFRGDIKEIAFTILAFFPEYRLKNVPSPNLSQMLKAYEVAKEAGLKNVRLGNIGIFARTSEDYESLKGLI